MISRLVFPALIVFASMFMATSVAAQDTDLVVRTAADPAQETYVGQRVVLTIDVLARDVWANLPGQDRFDIPGAIVVAPPNSSIRLTEQLRGGTFIGQRYEFWIYPQRAGALTIPALTLAVQLKPFGFGKQPTTQSATTEAIDLSVGYPDGVQPVPGLICTKEFSVTQSWQPAEGLFAVGDGVTRTITRTISGTPAMALSPFDELSISGARVYAKQPDVDDSFNRGNLTGKRVDRVTYMFDRAGEVELPNLTVTWWDLESNELRKEVLDGIKVNVQPAIADQAETFAEANDTNPHSATLVALGILSMLLLVVGYVYRRPLVDAVHRWRKELENSEPATFQRFVKTARQGNSLPTLKTLTHWWDVANPGDPAPRLDLFFARFADESGQSQLKDLQQAANQKSDWNAESLIRVTSAARCEWLRQARSQHKASESSLPPLNP